MKSLKFILLFTFVAAMASCSSDDDNTPAYELNKTNLVGIYQLNYYYSKEIKTFDLGNGLTSTVETTLDNSRSFQNASFEFKSDNTLKKSGLFVITKAVKQDGSNIGNPADSVIQWDKTVNYNLNATQNTLTIDGNEYDVQNFSSTSLNLKLHQETTDADGNVIKITKEMRFEK